MRLLIVEDERSLNEVLRKRLLLAHYSVDSCFDGQEALDYIRATEYDAIILDIMLPKIDGLSVLARLRSEGKQVPVLLLTAKDSIADKVRGLDAGADDYLVKPFSFDELLARVRALLRKSAPNKANDFRLADLKIDFASHRVTRGEKEITLSSREFAILEYLARNAGQVLTRGQISAHSWSYDYEGSSNIIDVYIRYLRKKIDEDFSPKLIHTVRGVGYILKE